MFALHLSLGHDESLSRDWTKIGNISPTDAVPPLEELAVQLKYVEYETAAMCAMERHIHSETKQYLQVQQIV